jgi:hypothetical protein
MIHAAPAVRLTRFAACLLLVPALAFAAKDKGEDDWPPITAEEKSLAKLSQDPEADAVVLSQERTGKIVRKGDDWVNALQYHWRLKVLTEAGKRYGEVRIRASKASRVSDIGARTVKRDGTVVPVSVDQIFEKVVFQVGSTKVTEWVFNFPAVEPGAILEYRYARHDNYFLYLDPFFFAGPEHTLRASVTQAFPESMGYSVLPDLCPAGARPVVSDWREGKLRGQQVTLELKDLPGYRSEFLMPPPREVGPHLEMVLMNWKGVYVEALGRQDRILIDWPSVAQYAGHYYDKAVREGQGVLKPLVEGWIQGAADPEQKVRAIFRHVQGDFRYIPFDNVFGWSRSIETLLKEKTADNEEKAVLLRAAFKAAGVDSHIALVSGKDSGSLNPKFFSLSQFTHAVVALPRPGGGYQWLDPTVAHAPFGFVPWKDSGAGALLIKDKQGEVIDLPVRNELSATRYRVTVSPLPGGRADLEVEAQYQGEDAIELREELLPIGEEARKTFLQTWADDERPGAVVKSYTIEHLDAIDQPLSIKMQLEAPGLVTMAEGIVLVRGCVLTCFDTNPITRGTRQHPFYVDRGWNDDETIIIRPPAGMGSAQTPPPLQARSSITSLNSSCSSQGDGSVRCTRQYVARRNRWPASELTSLRAMFERVVQADRGTVAFQQGGAAEAGGE